jgi:hypothetical protein
MCKAEKWERGKMGKANSSILSLFSTKTVSFPFSPLSLFSFPYTSLESAKQLQIWEIWGE